MAGLAVWRKSFWREYWRLARRSPKDRNALRTVALITLMLSYLAGVAAIVYWWLGGYALAAIAGAGALGIAGVRRMRPERLSDETEGRRHVRSFLVERAMILRALLMRAAAEVCLRHEQMPEGMESVTRQNQNAGLRELRLWDKLDPAEAELMMLPEGGWAEAQFVEILPWCEQLRLLRWVLRIDPDLMPLAQFPRTDLRLVSGLSDVPSRALPAHWEVRVVRDDALEYVARVFDELRKRQLVEPDEAAENWAMTVRYQGAGRDLEAGIQTVAELDDDDLGQLAIVAVARERYARYLVDLMETETITAYGPFIERAS